MEVASPAAAAIDVAIPLAVGARPAGLRRTLQPLALFAGLALLILTLSRLGLLGVYHGRLPDGPAVARLLVMGLRFDLVIIAALCALPLIGELLAPALILRTRSWAAVRAAWFTLWIFVVTFNEAATPAFMAEFGVRPNRQYVEYLDTPGVVFSTIWHTSRGSLFVGISLALLAAWSMRSLLRRVPAGLATPAPWVRVLVLLPLLVALGYLARGTLGHRPLSASNAALVPDATINDLALNSTYSVAYAVRQMLHEQDGLRGYGHLSEGEALARVQAVMDLPAEAFTEPARSTHHALVPTAHLATRPNLVILLQESLGAQYFASLGGQPVAQKLETWRERSFWFDSLYASGTRSARGIEAVVTGFQPTRTSSVIKLEGAQRNFFTLARVLKEQGYRTEFIYGGDASFDNMRRFFLNNGFDRVIDQKDLEPTAGFTTTWGVSDEDLYARVHEEVTRHYRESQPFFTLVFSTSNHPPYDFPDGRIELVEQPKLTHRNAARYADHAVGSYLEQASQSPYWANTLFTVVADHESKSIGTQLVPIFSFHIPAFIAGGPVQPRIVSRLASQVDLLPTTLSLMGLDVVIPATGIDQSRTDLAGPGHAMMQFNEDAAWRVGDRVAILMPHQPVREFRIFGEALLPVEIDPDFALDALAQSQVPIQAYREGWYR
ncbi:MAG: LTA synthase family protein [Gammaproteobacteria bacterium]